MKNRANLSRKQFILAISAITFVDLWTRPNGCLLFHFLFISVTDLEHLLHFCVQCNLFRDPLTAVTTVQYLPNLLLCSVQRKANQGAFQTICEQAVNQHAPPKAIL